MISGMRVRRRSAFSTGGYRFYRLWITKADLSNQFLQYVIIREFQFHSPQVPGGVPSGGTPFATAGGAPENAFDGDVSTQWASGSVSQSAPPPQAIGYEFPAPIKVTGYHLLGGSGLATTGGPEDWEFQASHDGNTWVTLDSQTGQSWTTSPDSAKDYWL